LDWPYSEGWCGPRWKAQKMWDTRAQGSFASPSLDPPTNSFSSSLTYTCTCTLSLSKKSQVPLCITCSKVYTHKHTTFVSGSNYRANQLAKLCNFIFTDSRWTQQAFGQEIRCQSLLLISQFFYQFLSQKWSWVHTDYLFTTQQ
jgi:hypothetical protein